MLSLFLVAAILSGSETCMIGDGTELRPAEPLAYMIAESDSCKCGDGCECRNEAEAASPLGKVTHVPAADKLPLFPGSPLSAEQSCASGNCSQSSRRNSLPTVSARSCSTGSCSSGQCSTTSRRRGPFGRRR